jgi:hypothetical protein
MSNILRFKNKNNKAPSNTAKKANTRNIGGTAVKPFGNYNNPSMQVKNQTMSSISGVQNVHVASEERHSNAQTPGPKPKKAENIRSISKQQKVYNSIKKENMSSLSHKANSKINR